MKFTVSTSALLKELQLVGGVINNNPVLPILEDFLFQLKGNTLQITGSDLETFVTSMVQVEAAEEGEIAIPSKILLETLKALPEQPVHFDINNETLALSIIAQTGKYHLAGESAEDFPEIPLTSEDTSEISIPVASLQKALSKTLFATSTDELRPAMTGVNFEIDTNGATFVATDAHKLVKYYNSNITHTEYTNFIVPRKALSLLKNALTSASGDVSIEYSSSNAFFDISGMGITCRLVDARYPDYSAVIPQNNTNILTVNRNDLEKAIKRLSIYSNKTTYQVKIKVSSGQIHLSAEDLDFSNEANEKMMCEYNGEPMEIAFNARYLAEVLNAMDGENIHLKLSNPGKAGIIVPTESEEGEELLMLVMPIMVSVNQY